MAISENFTDEELEAQLRSQFEEDEQWDMDFTTIFTFIVDRGVDLYLEFRGRKFVIDKLTGNVSEGGIE
jgi:hypothetical protein